MINVLVYKNASGRNIFFVKDILDNKLFGLSEMELLKESVEELSGIPEDGYTPISFKMMYDYVDDIFSTYQHPVPYYQEIKRGEIIPYDSEEIILSI